jgi:predicted permease
MAAILVSLVPIFALVALGAVFRRTGFLAEGFWRPAEKLTYFVLLPPLLVETLASADFAGLPVLGTALAVVLPVLAAAALLRLLRPALAVDDPGFTSVIQGGVRFNVFISFAAAASLHGKAGLAVAAMVAAVLIPVGNTLSIWALAASTGGGAGRAARALATNPLIIATLIGIALSASGLGLPSAIAPILRMLGSASLPLGLLAVGAGLERAAFRGHARPLAAAIVVKLGLVPALAALVCLLAGVTGIAAPVTILLQATPTAPSSYILARQLGGDAPLMAAILTVQTLASLATLPLVLGFLA